MHMADALLSPTVGGAMWTITAFTIAYCSKKVRSEMDDRKIPLMGVLGAFIFAAQMINFTIPVTGSSGHLGGGLILSILLGPYAAFLTIASVLVVQALFFADGGLLALGCNIFNLGFFPAFVAYPFIYRKISGSTPSPARISFAAMAAAVIGLQLGAFGVVVETFASGISSLPFATFAGIMQPIHLAIGMVEGLVTASVISFVYKAKPEILQSPVNEDPTDAHPFRNVILIFLALAVLCGGVLAWFASTLPDGLEWSISKAGGLKELKDSGQKSHGTLATFQKKLSFLPDYSFKKSSEEMKSEPLPADSQTQKQEVAKTGGSRLATTVSGMVGGTLTLGLSLIIAFFIKRRSRKA